MKSLTLGAGHIVHKKFNSCLYVNYRFNRPRVICDYVLIWIYKACTRAKQRLVFLRSLSFPGFLCHPVDTAWEGSEGPGHCPRIVENMILSSVIYSFFLDYWLDMSHLILASCSVHVRDTYCSPRLNWQFGNQFCLVNGEFHCIIFKIIQNLILNPKTTNTKQLSERESHRDFRETAAIASQSW